MSRILTCDCCGVDDTNAAVWSCTLVQSVSTNNDSVHCGADLCSKCMNHVRDIMSGIKRPKPPEQTTRAGE